MSDYRLEFGSSITPNDTDRLYQILPIVSKDDELEIIIQDKNSKEVGSIIDVLKSNEFDVSAIGHKDRGKLYLLVHRNN
ncbi:MAG TPA: hypothetical protein DD426_13210 [Clostridiaceae bacterium]|nr:hypothetical protein [Clostridiaceae bacterium]